MHDKIEIIKEKILSRKNIGKFEWSVLILLCSFIFFTMLFDDLIITYSHGLCFWDCLLEGELDRFYFFASEHGWKNWEACYYFPMYIIFAIWNFPIWCISQFTKIDVYSTIPLLWAKGINVLFIGLTAYYIYKILINLKIEKKQCCNLLFLYATSLNLVLPSLAMAQYDIICVFFLVLAIYEYYFNEKSWYTFLIIIAFAATLKIFALVLVIPIIILNEKKIILIIRDLLITMTGIILSILPFPEVFMTQSTQSNFNQGWSIELLEAVIPGGVSEIPLFVIIYIFICIWAYINKTDSREESFFCTNWIILAVLFEIFIFVYSHPQWIVLTVPFITFLIAQNNLKINYLLDLFLNISISIYYCFYYFWVYGTEKTFQYLLLNDMKIQFDGGYHNLVDYIVEHNYTVYMPAIFGVFVATAIALLFINRPGKVYENSNSNIEISYLQFRLIPILVYIVGTIIIAYFK